LGQFDGEVDHPTVNPDAPTGESGVEVCPGSHPSSNPARTAHRIGPCMRQDVSNRKATAKSKQRREFPPAQVHATCPLCTICTKRMAATDYQTQEAGTAFAVHDSAHAFVVLHIEGDERSRVLDLPDGVDVTFGRSRGATVTVESEKVSRMHARVRRTGDLIEVEDLGSRNGTRVNGDKIEGIRR